MTTMLSKCQHCYDLIREATITETAWPPAMAAGEPLVTPARRTAWLNAETRSPFCLRSACVGGEFHELRHQPMPKV